MLQEVVDDWKNRPCMMMMMLPSIAPRTLSVSKRSEPAICSNTNGVCAQVISQLCAECDNRYFFIFEKNWQFAPDGGTLVRNRLLT